MIGLFSRNVISYDIFISNLTVQSKEAFERPHHRLNSRTPEQLRRILCWLLDRYINNIKNEDKLLYISKKETQKLIFVSDGCGGWT